MRLLSFCACVLAALAVFTVALIIGLFIESFRKNSTFVCPFFIEGQSLYLDELTVDGQTFAMFVAGKNGGLKIVEKTENETL